MLNTGRAERRHWVRHCAADKPAMAGPKAHRSMPPQRCCAAGRMRAARSDLANYVTVGMSPSSKRRRVPPPSTSYWAFSILILAVWYGAVCRPRVRRGPW